MRIFSMKCKGNVMLSFYSFILLLYIGMFLLLLLNTRQSSNVFKTYETLQRQKLITVICQKNLFYINAHIAILFIIQIYVTWCAISILSLLNMFAIDSVIGICIISCIFFLLIFRRILIMTVVSKSALYL